jgi:hypothetical protein
VKSLDAAVPLQASCNSLANFGRRALAIVVTAFGAAAQTGFEI